MKVILESCKLTIGEIPAVMIIFFKQLIALNKLENLKSHLVSYISHSVLLAWNFVVLHTRDARFHELKQRGQCFFLMTK